MYVSVRADKRLFAVQHALERGYSVDAINRISHIDRWFLYRLKVIADMKAQTTSLGALDKLSVAHLRSLKIRGFSDRCVAYLLFSHGIPFELSLLSPSPLSLSLFSLSLSVPTGRWLATAGQRSWWCGGAGHS